MLMGRWCDKFAYLTAIFACTLKYLPTKNYPEAWTTVLFENIHVIIRVSSWVTTYTEATHEMLWCKNNVAIIVTLNNFAVSMFRCQSDQKVKSFQSAKQLTLHPSTPVCCHPASVSCCWVKCHTTCLYFLQSFFTVYSEGNIQYLCVGLSLHLSHDFRY